MWRKDPASQPIGNIRRIALRCNPAAQISGWINRARIVDSRGFIEPRDTSRVRQVDTLSQTIPTLRSRGSLADHLGDDTGRARVLHLARVIAMAGTIAVVALHQARVAHAVVGRWYADATAGFLYHDGEDEAVVDFGF